jgi:hypothetical protein
LRIAGPNYDQTSKAIYYGLPKCLPVKQNSRKEARDKVCNKQLRGIRKFSILPSSTRRYVRCAKISKSQTEAIFKQKEFGFLLNKTDYKEGTYLF